jgi:hypothetical protein
MLVLPIHSMLMSALDSSAALQPLGAAVLAWYGAARSSV